MAPNENRVFHEKVESHLEKCSRISFFDEHMKVRGSTYNHFPLSTLARGAMGKFIFSKKVSNMGLNGSAMGPHGLICNENGAKSCPMPLDALPTPFKGVLSPF